MAHSKIINKHNIINLLPFHMVYYHYYKKHISIKIVLTDLSQ